MKFIRSIVSTGTQYMDTEHIPTANTKVVMGFRLTTAGTGNHCVFGVDGQFSFRWYGASSVFRSNGKNNVNFAAGIDGTARHIVHKSATVCTLDLTYSVNNTAGTVAMSLYLFAQHSSSGATNFAPVEIEFCEILEGDELIRDYWPCIDDDGVVCMYDKVTETYRYNAGAGEFLAGFAPVFMPRIIEPPVPKGGI